MTTAHPDTPQKHIGPAHLKFMELDIFKQPFWSDHERYQQGERKPKAEQ